MQETKLGFARNDRTDGDRVVRAKRIVEYQSPEGRHFYAKYAKNTEENPFNVSNLENEQVLLHILQTSGVVPKIGEIKYYPNAKHPAQARLLLEALPGVSLEDSPYNQDQGRVLNPNDVIRATAKSLQIVHDHDILLVDVNPGSFIIDSPDGEMQSKIIDFEFGVYLKQHSSQRYASAAHFLETNDPGLRFGDTGLKGSRLTEHNKELLQAAEVYAWAMTMVQWLLGSIEQWPDVAVANDVQGRIDQDLNYFFEQIRLAAEIFYARVSDEVDREHRIQNVIEHEAKKLSISYTLKARLEQAGISLEPKILQFLEYSLKNMPESRFSHFTPIVRL